VTITSHITHHTSHIIHHTSLYTWRRFIPLCILTSCGWIFPIAAVLGLEEDVESLRLMYAAIAKQCQGQKVPCPAFEKFQRGFNRMREVFHTESHSWMATNMHTCLCPPNWERFAVGLFRDKKAFENLEELIPELVESEPTVHTDGGLAFSAFFPQVGWYPISCAIHLLSKVASCDQELRTAIKTLLYERNMSTAMAETLSTWVTQTAAVKPISSETRKRIIAMFGTADAMLKNTQAFRNIVFSAWYSCDTILETLFKHVKDEQRCIQSIAHHLGILC
jgi:hypothetical protein